MHIASQLDVQYVITVEARKSQLILTDSSLSS